MKFVLAALLFVACAQASVRPFRSVLRSVDSQKGTDTRINVGHFAKQGELPWMAFVLIYYANSQLTCGGTLISPEWVVTAAQCLQGNIKSIQVAMGSVNFYTMTQYIKTKKFINHEKYGTEGGYDIGLIQLPAPVEFSDRVRSIRLPSRNHHDLSWKTVRAAGFGVTETGAASNYLKYIDMLVMDKCTGHETNICVMGDDMEKPCEHDNGGPLVEYAPDPVLVGLMTGAPKGCGAPGPALYIRIISHLDWIHDKTGIAVK